MAADGSDALIQIRFSDAEFGKISPARQAQSPQIADSSSRNAVASHPRVQPIADRRRDVRLQSRLLARWNQSLKRSRNCTRLTDC